MPRKRHLALAGLAALAGVGTYRGARARRRAHLRRRVAIDTDDRATVDARHQAKVDQIVEQLRAHAPGTPVSLKKAAPPHSVPKWKDLRRDDAKIDVSALTEILEVDPVQRICIAESGAMFDDVVQATLRYGLVPKVVPELKSITIGGAVTGCSIESMSFQYGGFHDSCRAYEVITAKGEVLELRPDQLEFQMMQSSFGTLGILSRLVFELVPAKPFVKLVYERHPSARAYREAILRHSRAKDYDFIDGFVHGMDDFVLALGNFVDEAPYTNKYDWMKIYYLSTKTRDEDYLRTADYFFRYDRGVTSVTPKSWLGRLVLGKVFDSNTVLTLADKLHNFVLDKERPTITLDVFLPISKMEEFLAWYAREFDFFPLWCVPYKRVHDYEWLSDEFYANLEDGWFVDLAIYGMKPQTDKPYHQLMEQKLRELGGVKTLISHNYYTRDEFWQTWNKANYDAVKAITDPDNVFRDLYTKTCKAAMGIEEAA
jgi:FAD/FMN-containing dehydrogenase